MITSTNQFPQTPKVHTINVPIIFTTMPIQTWIAWAHPDIGFQTLTAHIRDPTLSIV